ncbi:hypothetical protein [Shewanella algae]|uniref:hypothetical protein n=1 Tax=Shewanella algae TaxID=38313 RepID=UPI001183D7A9|nr:hypothetical protein [Shewanella algae]MCT8979910.1 hypothetical protein [Shewanella algae]QTE86195.1 hypothetical protein JKK44_19480 [Shewanella algae]TVL11943.1 hypothetical protein AYI82_01650 [Shewanella algae]TVO91491.1 hypothetical protein AYI80_06485 [Shewanella algae]TXS87616.1 hypothetical protein AYI81_05850 [Shewanella algae]
MRKFVAGLFIVLFVSGCAASYASKYNTITKTDKFENQTTITMTGGVIDADYLGIVSNPAELNPFVIKDSANKIIALGVKFSMEQLSTAARGSWLNIGKGSTATFLLNNGNDKLVLVADDGVIDYSVSSGQRQVYVKEFDNGVFGISPEQLKKLADAQSVEIRVKGLNSSIDFPRRPNNSIVKAFLPNLNKFYYQEVQPYL